MPIEYQTHHTNNLDHFLCWTKFPIRNCGSDHSILLDSSIHVTTTLVAYQVDIRLTGTFLSRSDGIGAIAEAGHASGMLADLAAFPHMLKGELHHEVYER